MGPVGQGPMTGRALGRCAGGNALRFSNPPFAPGRARGRLIAGPGSGGGGWRHRYWFHATGVPGWLRG